MFRDTRVLSNGDIWYAPFEILPLVVAVGKGVAHMYFTFKLATTEGGTQATLVVFRTEKNLAGVCVFPRPFRCPVVFIPQEIFKHLEVPQKNKGPSAALLNSCKYIPTLPRMLAKGYYVMKNLHLSGWSLQATMNNVASFLDCCRGTKHKDTCSAWTQGH